MPRGLSSLEHSLRDAPLCFLHIPKTAGTTLIQVIERQFDEEEIARWLYPFRLVDTPREFFREHRYFHGHVDLAMMRSLLPREPVCMTVLRQPVERYLSHFGNHKRVTFNQIPDISRETYDALTRTSLEEFVLTPPPALKVLSHYFQDLQAKLLAAEPPANLPQHIRSIRANDYILPTPTLEQALARLESLAFIGLTERFQDSLFLLAYTFGWHPVTGYESRNAGPRPRKRELDDGLLKEIQDRNRLDQQVYERGCQLFEARFEQMQVELLERYGRREHAHEKLPLAPTRIAELLDRHYRQRFVERQPAVRALKLDCGRKMSRDNWYASERHPRHGAMRWSGPERRSYLDFPMSADAPLWLRFEVALAITPEVLESLVVTVNGEPVRLEVETGAHDVRVYRAYLSQSLLERQPGFVQVAFEVDQTLRPIEVLPESADDRLLGICLNRLEFTPAAPQQRGGVVHQLRAACQRLFKKLPLRDGSRERSWGSR